MGHADALFKGLGDPTRLRILNLLAAGELCVCDIVEILALPQSTISRHLGYLLRVELVEVSRTGRFAHYQLAEPQSSLHTHLLHGIVDFLGELDDLAAERRRAVARLSGAEVRTC
ncbi:MAG: ArsR/SmtB family transcription factor [Gemmatimonadales bacterium]